jgi:hypothetical protein
MAIYRHGIENQKSARCAPFNDRTSDRLCLPRRIERGLEIALKIERLFAAGSSLESVCVTDVDSKGSSGNCTWVSVCAWFLIAAWGGEGLWRQKNENNHPQRKSTHLTLRAKN